jgi:hypothetical protein
MYQTIKSKIYFNPTPILQLPAVTSVPLKHFVPDPTIEALL